MVNNPIILAMIINIDTIVANKFIIFSLKYKFPTKGKKIEKIKAILWLLSGLW